MHGWGRGKAGGGLGAGLAACALTAFTVVAPAATALAAPAGAVAAASPAWTIQNSPNAAISGGQLKSVSCSAADACTAVGGNLGTSGLNVTVAERWNGKSWQPQSTPNPTPPGGSPQLLGVSCPASNFCEAVGSFQVSSVGISLAEDWNGRTWTRQFFPAPISSASAGLSQVSCASARFCAAVGSYRNGVGENLAFAATWNGSSWRLEYPSNPAGATLVFMYGVSCVSPDFCLATGDSAFGGGPFAWRWNGTAWHLRTVPATVGIASVSCRSQTFCQTAGGATGAVWNGSQWSPQPIPGPAGSQFTSVSCSTAKSCEAVGNYNDTSGNTLSVAASWNGASWTSQTTQNPAGASFTSLYGVSCAAAAACEAVGDFQLSGSGLIALAQSWNGSSWRIQHGVALPSAAANSLNAVSCVSAVFCEAVGSHPDSFGVNAVALAEVWNGAVWRIQNTPSPAQAANGIRITLDGVSCVSARFCESVGASSSASGGGAEVWNGTKWALQAVPGGGLTSVSCTSAKFCVAAGGDGHVDIWNGKSWSSLATAAGFTSLSSVACISPRFCEAVGSGPPGDEAERWNGTSWFSQATAVPAGGSSPGLSAVWRTGVKSCEAVGSYSNSSFATVTLAEVWNGTAWVVQPTPNPATSVGSSDSLHGVWCTAANSCTAVGGYSALVSSFTLAEVWNGAKWALRSTPNLRYAGQSTFNAVSCGASHACTAVGVTDDVGGISATLIETGD
jgi:hypothetical protein